MSAVFQPDLLVGKVALVTGGGTGIGLTIARALGQVGAEVVLAARNTERLAKAADGLAADGIKASWTALNIRDADQVSQVVDEVVERQGGVDILVNNAGGQFPVKAEELSPNGWRSVVDLNLNGTFYVTSAAGRHMIARGSGGTVLSVVFNTQEHPIPGNVHSAAARAGVMQMTRTLAVEWAQFGITVNAIGPLFLSEAAQAAYGDEVAALVAGRTPMQRWATPQEMGAWAVVLCSPVASYVTGLMVPLDGGNRLTSGLAWRGTPVLPE
ncbi:MAG TPA: SDR family oxidoreductase [Nocardioidaceae bacterium]|nr:SDR family oxidoreductase [Nocardioidaceae bacterium]